MKKDMFKKLLSIALTVLLMSQMVPVSMNVFAEEGPKYGVDGIETVLTDTTKKAYEDAEKASESAESAGEAAGAAKENADQL